MFLSRRIFICVSLALAFAATSQLCVAQATASTSKAAPFPPLEQWKAAVISGNEAKLKALYSTNPPAKVILEKDEFGPENDVAFWIDLKAHQIKLEMIHSESPQPGARQVVFQAEIQSGEGPGKHVVYVTDAQLWQQQGKQWRLMATKRSDPTRLKQPTSVTKDIYPASIDAHAEINHALQDAAGTHKRVILVFGANWCYDCHVLDLAFHRADLSSVLQHNYEVVHVDVGNGDKNQDIMQQYHVPMAKGIPALAVLDGNGKLLYSQTGGEFEKARSLAPEDLLQFLNKWKPVTQ